MTTWKRGKNSLGFKLLEFSYFEKSRMKIRDVALPFLEEFNRKVDESVNLAVMDSGEAIYVEHIGSRHVLQTFTQVGKRVPLHCTSIGKVFLSSMSEGELSNYITSPGLAKYTLKTITNSNKLSREVIRVREKGVARDNEEGVTQNQNPKVLFVLGLKSKLLGRRRNWHNEYDCLLQAGD